MHHPPPLSLSPSLPPSLSLSLQRRWRHGAVSHSLPAASQQPLAARVAPVTRGGAATGFIRTPAHWQRGGRKKKSPTTPRTLQRPATSWLGGLTDRNSVAARQPRSSCWDMARPEQVLLLEPPHELKFRGRSRGEGPAVEQGKEGGGDASASGVRRRGGGGRGERGGRPMFWEPNLWRSCWLFDCVTLQWNPGEAAPRGRQVNQPASWD